MPAVGRITLVAKVAMCHESAPTDSNAPGQLIGFTVRGPGCAHVLVDVGDLIT